MFTMQYLTRMYLVRLVNRATHHITDERASGVVLDGIPNSFGSNTFLWLQSNIISLFAHFTNMNWTVLVLWYGLRCYMVKATRDCELLSLTNNSYLQTPYSTVTKLRQAIVLFLRSVKKRYCITMSYWCSNQHVHFGNYWENDSQLGFWDDTISTFRNPQCLGLGLPFDSILSMSSKSQNVNLLKRIHQENLSH